MPLKLPKARIGDVVQVVGHGVARGAKPVLRSVTLEVGFHSGEGEIGMEGREDETPSRAKRGECLGEEASEIEEMLRHERREKGVEDAGTDGENPIEIGLGKLGPWCGLPRHAQHSA